MATTAETAPTSATAAAAGGGVSNSRGDDARIYPGIPVYHDMPKEEGGAAPLSSLSPPRRKTWLTRCGACVCTCLNWRNSKYWSIGFVILVVFVVARGVVRAKRQEARSDEVVTFFKDFYAKHSINLPNPLHMAQRNAAADRSVVATTNKDDEEDDDKILAGLTRSRFRLIDEAAAAARLPRSITSPTKTTTDDDTGGGGDDDEEEETVDSTTIKNDIATAVQRRHVSRPQRLINFSRQTPVVKMGMVWFLALIQALVSIVLYLVSLLFVNAYGEGISVEARVVTSNLIAACAIAVTAAKFSIMC